MSSNRETPSSTNYWNYAYGSVVGVAAYFAFAPVAATGLAAAGFSYTGVVAGSTAAGIQAGIGNVAAGSWFAFFTSWGMAGTSAGASATAAGAAGASTTLFGHLYDMFCRKTRRS